MNTRNTSMATTAVCMSFNYCAPTQSFSNNVFVRRATSEKGNLDKKKTTAKAKPSNHVQ